MADYLKSALNYFSSSSTGKNDNEFVGSFISVGPLTLKVKRVIAEGAYGVVYEAVDNADGNAYALKRMISHDKQTNDLILHEIKILKQLSGHDNIIRFYNAASVGRERMKVVGMEFLLVSELCTGGQLSEYLPVPHQESPLPASIILPIMYQTCRAVQHMHNQCPPIIHRDLKMENLLLSSNYIIKLCDFGSSSTTTHNPDNTWSGLKRGTVQEELERFTTPMYRAPEMLDLYQNFPIGTASDIWALGCVLFYLTCTYHPFEDSSKLAILNANYSFASNSSSEHMSFHGLIRQMLLIDPRQRPNINELIGELSEMASARELSVSGPIKIRQELEKRRNLNKPQSSIPTPSTPTRVGSLDVLLFVGLDNLVANVPSPFEETSSVRSTLEDALMMSPRMVTERLQLNFQVRRKIQHVKAGLVQKNLNISEMYLLIYSLPKPDPVDVRSNHESPIPSHHLEVNPGPKSSTTPQSHPPPPRPTAPGPNPSTLKPATSPSRSNFASDNPQSRPSQPQSSQASVGNMLGMLKGGAGSLFKNIRDASTKVLESVSTSLNTELDVQFITSRLAVMPFPSESGLEALGSTNLMEEIQAMLDSQFRDSYAVYNLSTRTYRSDRWFHGRVSHRAFEPHRAPSLKSLIELCCNARLWLAQNPTNICVIHCTDGRALSAIFVCSFLCFVRMFDNASPAVQLFASKRGNPHLTSSQLRYIEYVCQLAHKRHTPHNHPIRLISLNIAPIPTFNKSKNGCRPYVEIYQGKLKVFSNYKDYDNLRPYVLEDAKIEVLFNGLTVVGDLTVIIYHCRSSFAGRGKIASAKIAQFQLHTGFLEPTQTELIYFKSDLDYLDQSSGFSGFSSRYAESFHVSLEFMVSPNDHSHESPDVVSPWKILPPTKSLHPELCVSNPEELKIIMSDFGRFNRVNSQKKTETRAKLVSTSISEPESPIQNIHLDQVLQSEANDEILIDATNAIHFTNKTKIEYDLEQCDPNGSSSPDLSTPKQEDTPVVDLLGLGVDSPNHELTAKPSPVQPEVPADSVLIDVEQESTDKTSNHFQENARNSNPVHTNADSSNQPIFEADFFNLSSQSNPVESTWEDAFGSSVDPDLPSTSVSNNPFDPFGIPTCEPVDLFDLHSNNAPPTSSTDYPTQPDLFTEGHMNTSVSASNLNAFPHNPIFTSASYGSLSSSNGPKDSGKTGDRVNLDPFADLSDLFGHRTSSAGHIPDANSGKPPMGMFSANPSPVHQDRRENDQDLQGSPLHSQPSNRKDNPIPTKSSPANPSWSTFNTSTASSNATHGARPQVNKDAFSDLLGGFGSSRSEHADDKQQTKTINQMRREKLAKITDPEQMKVLDWAEGKDRNLRALLCSLPSILWDGVRWKQVGMTDLITTEQVKRQYRNAARAVHPDKWAKTPNENLARLVFLELNDAMTEFEKEPALNANFNL